MGVDGILNNIDVAVVREFTLLLTDSLLVLIATTVPQFAIVFRDGILLTNSGQRVFDVPTTRSLESVRIDLRPRQVLTIRCGEESDHGKTITGLIQFRFPESFVSTTTLGGTRLLNLLHQFRCEGTKRGLFFKGRKRH